MKNVQEKRVSLFSVWHNARLRYAVLPAVFAVAMISVESSSRAEAACVVEPDGITVTCTGNESDGIASGTDFLTPPITTLHVFTDPITTSLDTASGINFSNSTASSVSVVSGDAGTPVAISTHGTSAPGIKASSEGSPSGYHWQPGLGLYVPNGPAGGGGPVTVENNGAIMTSGANSHGIFARNRVGAYNPVSTLTLLSFTTSAVSTSLVSVAGSSANIGTAVAGDNGGAFTLNSDGTVSFDRGTLGDSLQPGESIVTSITYQVSLSRNALFPFIPAGSQFSDGTVAVKIVNENGTITVEPLEISFAGFGVKSDPGGAAPLWPDIQQYVDRLKAEEGFGGAGESVSVTNSGNITTTGNNAHGIYAETTGGNGATGSEGGLFDGPAGVGGTGSGGGGATVTADGAITTYGNQSAGVAAVSRGGNGGTGGDGGWGGWRWGGQGGNGGDGGAVYVHGSGTIETGAIPAGQTSTDSGSKSSGILALSEGGNGGNGGWGGRGGAVVVDGSWSITTRGDGAHGIWAKSVGGNAGSGGSAGWMGISGGGSGGQAADGGSVTVTSRGAITTWGANAYGIFGQSVGGFGGSGGDGGYLFYSNNGDGNSAGSGGAVTVTNGPQGTITTHGAWGYGIYAQSVGGGGGAGAGGGGPVSLGGTGGAGGNGGAVTVTNNGMIHTFGAFARGIYAESIGGGGGSGGGSGGIVSVGGDGSGGGDGGQVTVTNTGSIRAEGPGASGIVARSVGGGGGEGAGSGGVVTIGGDGSSTGNGATVNVVNSGTIEIGSIISNPIESWVWSLVSMVIEGPTGAIRAQSIGGGGGSGAGSGGVVSLGGDGAAGGNGGEVTVTNNGTLITWADFSRGIYAQSIGGGGGDGAGSGGVVSLGGNATGLDTDGDGTIDLPGGGNGNKVTVVNSASITTHGDFSDGIYAQSIGGGGGSGAGSGGGVSLGGDGSASGDGNEVTVTNSGTIRAGGYRSRGIFAQSIGGGGGDGAASGGLLFSEGGGGAKSGNGDKVTVTNSGTIETGTVDPALVDLGIIEPGTIMQGFSSAIQAQSVGGGGGSGASSGGLASFGGSGASAGSGGEVTVINSGTLITWADYSRGILAQSIGGGGGEGAASGGLIVGMGGSTGADTDGDGALDTGGGDGGSVTVTNSGSITTHGDYGDGIYAQSIGGGGGSGGGGYGFGGIGGSGSRGGAGGLVTISNSGTITTAGYRSRGIFAESIGGGGGDGGFAGGAFTYGGSGSSTDNAGDISITNTGTIETVLDGSIGIHAQSIGGGGGSGGSARSYTAGANISLGDSIGGRGGGGGDGGIVAIDNRNAITTHGASSHGMYAQSVGGGGGNGGSSLTFSFTAGVIPEVPIAISSTTSIGGQGGSAGDGGERVEIDNSGSIATTGFRSYGIYAQSVGGGGGDGGNSSTINIAVNCNITATQAIGGDGGTGGDGKLVRVGEPDATGGTITTQGNHAIGILAQSVGGGGGAGGDSTVVNVDLSIPTSLEDLFPGFYNFSLSNSLGGSGGVAGNGGTVEVYSGNTIGTSGSFAHGILAQSVGGGGGAGGDARSYDFSFSANPSDYIPYIDVISYSSTSILGGNGGSGGDGVQVTVSSSGAITTTGASAHGILAQSVGGGGGAAGSALTFGFSTTDIVDVPDLPFSLTNLESVIQGGAGASGNGGNVMVTNTGAITTSGNMSHGILAQSVGGGGGYIAAVNPQGVTNTSFDSNTRGILSASAGVGASFIGSLGGSGYGGAVTVTQTGDITTQGYASHGILAQSAGGSGAGPVNVTTSGDISAQGVDSNGILAQSVSGWHNGNISVTVSSGAVSGGTGTGAGVSFLDGAANTLENHGTITTLSSLAGTAVRGAGGNETVNNYGTVTGSVELGSGTNTFTNTLTGTFNSGLIVNLGTGNLFTNSGTLSPGGQGECLTSALTGNFTQTGTGTMAMEINRYGDHDKLVVSSGSATLGGRLSVAREGGPYQNGMKYDIVEATDNAILGTFDSASLPNGGPLLSFALIQSSNVVELEVIAPKVTTVATNPVEYAMAEYLDRIMPNATGDLATVLGEFQALGSSQLGPAFISMSSGSYTSLSRVGLTGIGLFLGDLKQRMGSLRSNIMNAGTGNDRKPILLAYSGSAADLGRVVTIDQSSRIQSRNGLWINSYGQWGNHQALPGYTGYDYTLYGSTIGYDYTFQSNLLVGASFGISRAEVGFGGNRGDGSVNSVTGALYGSYYLGNAYIEGAFSYGKQRYHNNRLVTVGSILREASGKHDADAFTTYLGGGYDFAISGLTVSPFASLRHTHIAEEGFTETGAGSLNLVVDNRKTDSLVSELGVRLARVFTVGNVSLVSELSAAFSYDFDIDDQVVTAAFAGAPGNSFSIRGEDVEKYGAIVGAGLTFIHRSGLSAVLKYSGEFRERNSTHGLMGEFRCMF